MKRNLKWTVLAVAISAATAMSANASDFDDGDSDDVDHNIEINATVNYERNYLFDKTVITKDKNVDVKVDKDVDEHEVSVSLKKDLSLTSDITWSGNPTVGGHIDFDSAAIAVIDNRQTITGNLGSNQQLTNGASIADDVAKDAEGNLAFNVSAGDNNVQDNAAALSAADASFAFGMADSEIFVQQMGAGNLTSNLGNTNAASISGNAFQNASGNIGVNVTSGNNNAQKNALAASVATSAYATATVSSDQTSTNNIVANAPLERTYYDRTAISMTGTVSGKTVASGSGSYTGTESGKYAGEGAAYQMDNFYLDSWNGELDHPSGSSTGHLDMDYDIQNAVMNPDKDGVGGIAFDTKEEGTYSGNEKGTLKYEELGWSDLYASLSGFVTNTEFMLVSAATNSASLSGSAFSSASGNIGVNVSAGTGNQQANSLSMAVAQPSAGGGGGGGEAPPPPPPPPAG